MFRQGESPGWIGSLILLVSEVKRCEPNVKTKRLAIIRHVDEKAERARAKVGLLQHDRVVVVGHRTDDAAQHETRKRRVQEARALKAQGSRTPGERLAHVLWCSRRQVMAVRAHQPSPA